MNLLILLLLVAAPAPPPTAWKPLIGVYGNPPDLVYVLEKDGELQQYSEKAGYKKITPAEAKSLKRFPISQRIHAVHSVASLRPDAMKASPPSEPGPFLTPDFVELKKLSPAIHLDIRYATKNDFLATPFYTQARAFLQRPAAEALAKALAQLQTEGFGLLIHDGYRPWYVTKMFWDAVPEEDHVFVADPSKGSKHNRGCAVDLSLYDLKTGKPIEMTGEYDEMSVRSYPNFPGGTSRQRWHRDLLRRAMEANGFTVFEAEWWHFDYKDWGRYPISNIPFEQIQ
jgi:D-alanyl-D-alanine dipeptidase